jgi:hypothetical protein
VTPAAGVTFKEQRTRVFAPAAYYPEPDLGAELWVPLGHASRSWQARKVYGNSFTFGYRFRDNNHLFVSKKNRWTGDPAIC